MGEARNAYRMLTGKFLRKWPLGGPRRSEKNIKMELREIGCENKWIELSQEQVQLGLQY
jgi:hypothetical protein